MKNLGILFNPFYKYWNHNHVIFLFLIFFFIIIIGYSFFYNVYEGMGLTAKMIYHPLEDITGMIHYYKFDNDEETQIYLPGILNRAAPISQDNLFDAKCASDSSTGSILNLMIDINNAKVGNASLKLNAMEKQYVILPSFNIPDTGMTFTLWFSILDIPDYGNPGIMTLFDYSNDNSNYRLTAYYIVSTKQIQCVTTFSSDNKQTIQTVNIQMDSNKWYHFVWSMTPDNGGKSTIYINGVKNQQLNSNFTYPVRSLFNNTSLLCTQNFIGKCKSPISTYPSIVDYYFNGYIDQYIVYNSAYDDTKVTNLYNSFSIMTVQGFSNIQEGLDEGFKESLDDGLTFTIYKGYMDDDPYFTKNAIKLLSEGKVVTGKTKEIKDITTGTNGFIIPHQSLHTYTVEWYGYFKPDKTGNWFFGTSSDDCSYLWIGDVATYMYNVNNATVNNGRLHGMQGVFPQSPTWLDQNQSYPIRIQFGENYGGHSMEVYFRHESEPPGIYRTNANGMYFS
jgi:hypothetical protein